MQNDQNSTKTPRAYVSRGPTTWDDRRRKWQACVVRFPTVVFSHCHKTVNLPQKHPKNHRRVVDRNNVSKYAKTIYHLVIWHMDLMGKSSINGNFPLPCLITGGYVKIIYQKTRFMAYNPTGTMSGLPTHREEQFCPGRVSGNPSKGTVGYRIAMLDILFGSFFWGSLPSDHNGYTTIGSTNGT